jgi:hypothetical protein
MPKSLSGSCSCGAVAYRLTAPPMFVNCCHCLACQKETGGAFVINALIEASNVKVTKGKPRPVTMPTVSGSPHEIFRCPTCKVALWSDYGRRRVLLFVRVSTLDKPHAIKPDAHIFTRSKVPWVGLPKDVPAFPVFYDPSKQWSAKSQARRKALFS